MLFAAATVVIDARPAARSSLLRSFLCAASMSAAERISMSRLGVSGRTLCPFSEQASPLHGARVS
jgi:hypothetical protein